MTNSFFKKVTLGLTGAAVALCSCANAQSSGTTITGQTKLNTITTAVPFITISPDASAGAMGDCGIATESDANDIAWNIAKVVNNKKKTGASLTYTPWLRDLVPDINLAYLAGYTKFGTNNNQAISGSLRYFNLGSINFRDANGIEQGTGLPREFAFDAGYSRKLSEKFMVGVAGRYINSNLSAGPSTIPGSVIKPANAFAVDIAAFYTKPMNSEEENGDRLNLGATITNLGSKVSYNQLTKDFLPTKLGIGSNYKHKIDEFNAISFSLDATKLLVPSPYFENDTLIGGQVVERQKYHREMSVINGLFSSFGDAPGGGSEEFKEVNWSIGTEYSYQNQVFARAGYFYEHATKGNRKFATMGLGFKYNVFTLNLSYVIPSGSNINRNPLSNTLRFSLLFDFEAAKKVKADEDKDEE
jgi:Type IX secretion system protein PorV